MVVNAKKVSEAVIQGAKVVGEAAVDGAKKAGEVAVEQAKIAKTQIEQTIEQQMDEYRKEEEKMKQQAAKVARRKAGRFLFLDQRFAITQDNYRWTRMHGWMTDIVAQDHICIERTIRVFQLTYIFCRTILHTNGACKMLVDNIFHACVLSHVRQVSI